MLKIKALFPNKNALHARVDTLLHNSSVGKITLVSSLPRSQSKVLLDAIVSDPIDDSHWFPSLRDRPLSKDILVSQSDAFEFIQTRNSLTEFPVPFRGTPVEIQEVETTSKEHIETSDLIVTLGDQVVQGFPTIIVEDDAFKSPQHSRNKYRINTAKALEGDELLRQSPSNISQYLSLYSESGLKPLKERIFQPVAVLRRDLMESVVETCEDLISISEKELKNTSGTSDRALRLRTSWNRDAHRELQLMLEKFDRTLGSKLAWFALYYRVDDVETVLTDIPVLPQSRVTLEYASGQIDALVQSPHTVRPALALDVLATNIRMEAIALHNKALKYLAINVLGVQAPIIAVAGAGLYFEQFSAYSMAALAGLGLVVGFNRLQKTWMAACRRFMDSVNQNSQLAISQSEEALWSIYEEKRVNQADHIQEQRKAVEDVKGELAVITAKSANTSASPRA